MPGEDLKAFELVAIQHELAMVIGLDLDLDRMLSPFMRACLRRLGLRSVHFYLAQPSDETGAPDQVWSCDEAQRRLSMPSVSGASEEVAVLDSLSGEIDPTSTAGTVIERDDRHFLVFVLPNVGFVVLERAFPMDPSVAKSLEPIFTRLTTSCRACLEHARTLDEIAARKAAEATIVRQAAYDELTDLPNRKTLGRRLRQAVAGAVRHGHLGAIYFIDVDRFKAVNDTMGHAAGDALLKEFARRLASTARAEDTIARMGGDEFVLVVSNLGDTLDQASYAARVLAHRITELCSAPIFAEGSRLAVSASIGLALFPNPALEGVDLDQHCEDLLRFADTAMYRAKEQRRGGFQFFAPEMQALSNRRLEIEGELRKALEGDEFEVLYQPVVTPAGILVGAEALLRWSNDVLGAVPPDEFIPVAEDTGIIVDVGLWTLRRACELIARLHELSTDPDLRVSVNISARQIRQPNFVDQVLSCIREAGIPNRALMLELTESAAVADIEDTIRKMEALREAGVLFALDDFGTGYSSLSYLHRLPVSRLKIDRSFISNIHAHPENQSIVDATIAMAHRLGIECVVEGVESAEDVEYFRGVPVAAMQGYHFSRPIPEDELTKAVARKRLGAVAAT